MTHIRSFPISIPYRDYSRSPHAHVSSCTPCIISSLCACLPWSLPVSLIEVCLCFLRRGQHEMVVHSSCTSSSDVVHNTHWNRWSFWFRLDGNRDAFGFERKTIEGQTEETVRRNRRDERRRWHWDGACRMGAQNTKEKRTERTHRPLRTRCGNFTCKQERRRGNQAAGAHACQHVARVVCQRCGSADSKPIRHALSC